MAVSSYDAAIVDEQTGIKDYVKTFRVFLDMDRHRVHGMILSNLTKQRNRPEIQPEEVASIPVGGINGDRYTIIGCGGVFSAQDAYEKIRQGATLVQLITGMIFEGPQLIGEINQGLVSLLKRDGYQHISQAIGAAHRLK
ncbi:hypothetical protein FJZ48_02335 [Candidatus Uhrbacteria bacterium]|nr:hypothetical protein [Candidatus Uhrbacteria bacterium]